MARKKVLDESNWEDVKSSNITQINYDPDQRILGIRFKGNREYFYHPVTEEGYLSFKKAKSLGIHFNKHIKNNANIDTYTHPE